MNSTTSATERTMLADKDLEESRNGNETEIDASGLQFDSVIPTSEKENLAGHENNTTEAPKRAHAHEKVDHIAIAAIAKNSNSISKCFILCAFAVVAVASGVTGALIARRQSPDAIALIIDPSVPQSAISPTIAPPTTAPSTYSNPTEEPTSSTYSNPTEVPTSSTDSNPTGEPTSSPKTASPTTLTSPLSPRQSAILDAFAEFGPVHEEAFEWLLNTDAWTSSPMVSADAKFMWHQRYAVATLFYSTDVPYLVNSSFRTSNSVCEWAGIECSDGLEVDELDLSDSMMSGSIPTEIGILSGLSYLDITSNNIGGSLPSEIGLLSDLNDVLLSHNSITGSFPSEIGLLSSLWFLYADHNKFSGSLPPQLGKFLGVDLSFNQLSKNLPEALFTDQLSMLILNDNRLSGSLPESLLEASQLTTLWVWNNQLTGIIPPLNEILSSCKLGNNEFSDMTNGEGFCLF